VHEYNEMAKLIRERDEAYTLIRALTDHLDYCGWGDSWEREVSEPLQRMVKEWEKRHAQ